MVQQSSSTQLYGTPKVGRDILAYCTRCKMELAHVIVSMIDTRPAKVLCKTCRTQHNFRRRGSEGPGLPSSRAPKASLRQPTSLIRVAELWEKKLAENTSGNLQTYSPKGAFAKGDVIQHPKFGMGLVEEVRRHGKILVFFRDGEKILVHAGTDAQSNVSR